MIEDATLFYDRFFKGAEQPNALLQGLAGLLREAPDHFDPMAASMLQVSVLKFITGTILESHKSFQNMAVTTHQGIRFPDFLRDLTGMDVAYVIFCFPKAQYPDIGLYLEAIPDMARFIDLFNDVFSSVHPTPISMLS